MPCSAPPRGNRPCKRGSNGPAVVENGRRQRDGPQGKDQTAPDARRTILDVPKDGADTPLADALHAMPFATARYLSGKRELHGKAFEFHRDRRPLLALGSGNCTEAALERTAGERYGNLEFLAVMENVTLPEEGIEFSEISDVAAFPYTGRAWDEGRSAPPSLKWSHA